MDENEQAQPRPSKLFRRALIVRRIVLGWVTLWALTRFIVVELQPGLAGDAIAAVNNVLSMGVGARFVLLLFATLLIFLFVFVTSRGSDEPRNLPDRF